MATHYVPQRPWRYKPGKEFIDNNGNVEGLRVGIVQRVDAINMKADVKIIAGQGYRTDVEISQAMCGPRSFWGGLPEIGSLVMVGFRMTSAKNNLADAVIVGYLPMGNRLGIRYDPFAPSDPTAVDPEDVSDYEEEFGGPVRYKRFKMSPGDVGGMSSSGAEVLLNRSVNLVNRAGDLIELRDEERTLVTQSIHRFDNEAGVRRYSGPVRRQVFWVPPEIVTTKDDGTKVLKSTADGYYGRDDFQSIGPGAAGAATKFANSDGELHENFNNAKLFPPVTYSNGKTVFYPSTMPNISLEGDPDEGAGAAFTEVRTEIAHDTELVQEVHTEIDGFCPNPRAPYIEHVLGTVIGNDAYSTQGLKQYGQALRPQMWTHGKSLTQGKFSLETISRGANGDLDVRTSAAAFLFRINPVEAKDDGTAFAVAVQKQGKLFVQVPKPSNESYGDNVKGVSADVNLLGALKLFLGSASPTKTSLFAKFDGGIKAEIGRNTDTGNSLDIVFTGPVKNNYIGATDAQGNGLSTNVSGKYAVTVSGDKNIQTGGSLNIVANGAATTKADKIVHQAISGYTINASGFQQTVTGMTYLTYAQLKTETIATGGELKNVMAGAVVETVAGGAKSVTVNGALTTNVTAAITETSGAAIAQTSGAAFTVTAGAAYSLNATAAVSLTAGAVMTLTAPPGIALVSANVMLGSPAAAFGVARGIPAMPPGSPTLDYITGLPLLGSLGVRSD